MERSNLGSVKRAREMAMAAGPPPRRPPKNDVQRGDSPPGNLSPPPRRHMPTAQMYDENPTFYWGESVQRPPQPPQQASTRQNKPRMPPGADFKGGAVISRPTQAPHWPLPPNSPLRVANPDNSHLGTGQVRQPPPRPQRPSRIPSMLDQSRPQAPTPIFLNPQLYQGEQRESFMSQNVSTPGTYASSRLTTSSVGTIPDFPVPTANSARTPHISLMANTPMPSTPRKIANLGPPPTTRRGVSSYYSITSNVSPIPEESLRTAGSYASSFAMPNKWNMSSETSSPKFPEDVYYDDSPTRSRDSYDSGDEIKLVRSASIGKKAKASLVDTRAPNAQPPPVRPSPNPMPASFNSGTGYVDASTSSSEQTLPHKYRQGPTDSTMNEPIAATLDRTSPIPRTASPEGELPSSRIPVAAQSPSPATAAPVKRPPKLDIDAVRKAEARGSLTSLPDLIKRATRLVAMMDTGKRPASRLDNLSDFFEKSDNNDGQDRHQSGLSEMLNAFPPPASRNGRRSRGSWFRTTSWPLAPGRHGGVNGSDQNQEKSSFDDLNDEERPRPNRKCCGMPPWAFILLVILLLCMIAVAIVIPLQFFVFKTLGNQAESKSELEQCRSDLSCQNGGTNVISQGTCSCICTNGFGGSDCSEGGSAACTTTNLASMDPDSGIEDVTIGRALPRLIVGASTNFSIPLSGTVILAKINSEDISCLRQNALVSFGGRATRIGQADSEVADMGDGSDEPLDLSGDAVVVDTDAVQTSTGDDRDEASPTAAPTRVKRWTPITATEDLSNPEPTEADNESPTSRISSPAYNVTEEALDFARIAVLYVLQEQSITEASSAQTGLERFFNQASKANPQLEAPTEKDAMNVTFGGANSVDMVNYRIDLGKGIIGGDDAT